MVVEKFSQSVLNSGIFKVYIAAGFFGTLIFFIINAHLFSPLEMIFGIVGVTIILKGISNMMFSMIILLFNLDNKKSELDFKYHSEKIESLINELNIKEANINNENK